MTYDNHADFIDELIMSGEEDSTLNNYYDGHNDFIFYDSIFCFYDGNPGSWTHLQELMDTLDIECIRVYFQVEYCASPKDFLNIIHTSEHYYSGAIELERFQDLLLRQHEIG